MRKNNLLIIRLLSCIIILGFYIWRFSPFLPHINRNDDGRFTYGNVTYTEYTEEDFKTHLRFKYVTNTEVWLFLLHNYHKVS